MPLSDRELLSLDVSGGEGSARLKELSLVDLRRCESLAYQLKLATKKLWDRKGPNTRPTTTEAQMNAASVRWQKIHERLRWVVKGGA